MNPEDTKTLRLLATQKAQEMWASFAENERNICRFGMLPATKMQLAVAQGYDSKLLAVALFDCAQKDGGMIA